MPNHTTVTQVVHPQPALAVTNLGKEYKLYDNPRDRFKALLTGRSYHQSYWALHDVSFSLGRGQCMGVVGDNGAGKSTLLKLIVGTLQPTQGTITRPQRITAILELGAGFHVDFTGRENLYFGGSLIGLSQGEIRELELDIIAFSELGEAIDRPVKTYSSGMVVRLAFALVTAKEPDVLIIDEALAVGDQHFQKKCGERINEFRNNGCTILFCSHSFYHIRQLCNVAVWMNKGRVQSLGDVDAVLAQYETHTRLMESQSTGIADTNPPSNNMPGMPASAADTPLAEGMAGKIIDVHVANLQPGEVPTLVGQDLAVTVKAQTASNAPCPHMAVMLEQSHGVGITSVATHAEGISPRQTGPNLWEITLTFPKLPLHSGQYVVSAYLFDANGLVVYDEWYRYQHFQHHNPTLTPGLVQLPHHWS